jgi:hypothetical protein
MITGPQNFAGKLTLEEQRAIVGGLCDSLAPDDTRPYIPQGILDHSFTRQAISDFLVAAFLRSWS